MGDRKEKSKRQSDGSQDRSQPDPFVLFLDETSHNCAPIHEALGSMSIAFERHGAHFTSGVNDETWLPEIGKRGWAVLTCDKRIRYNELERLQIVRHRIRQFVFTSGNMSGVMMGEALRVAIPKMLRLFSSHPAPFIAYISKSGNVEVRFDKQGVVHRTKTRQ